MARATKGKVTDKMRLDFMQKYGITLSVIMYGDPDGGFACSAMGYQQWPDTKQTARQAIDAAMRHKGGSGK